MLPAPPLIVPLIPPESGVVLMPGTSSWQLRDGEQLIVCNGSLLGHRHFLIAITRVRNEALILRDTLDYVGKHVDALVAYDDASTDRTLEILAGHPKVALIEFDPCPDRSIGARFAGFAANSRNWSPPASFLRRTRPRSIVITGRSNRDRILVS